MQMSFEGRHVVITGGTGALGSAVVARLLETGAICHVPVLEHEPPDHADDPRVRYYPGVDLTKEAAVEVFYEAVAGRAAAAKSRLWGSVHCAGGFAMSPAVETSAEAFEAQWRLNTLSVFLCCREAAKCIRRAGGGGRLVNVAARPALFAELGDGMAAYAASKAGVAALTQSLGCEWSGADLWVNAVVPSIMDTPANRDAMPNADHASWPSVESVAETVVFLASPWNLSTRAALVPVYGRS